VPTLDLEQKPLYGCKVPRIWTPPLRELNRNTSLGWAAIRFARDVLNVKLDPWQKWLLIHALELREDGTFRFRNVVVLVGRQNGKSTLAQVLALFCLYCIGTRLILGTAQDLDTATETWEGTLALIEDTPELEELADKPILVNGNKTIRLKSSRATDGMTNGERYKVKAANRRAGRGLSGDLILLDELREHQTWEAWAAITGTTNARPNAQIWSLSNAGDATSVVLRYLRKTAHAALGDPDGINAADDPASLLAAATAVDSDGEDVEIEEVDDDTLGIFEWSAPPGCHIKDRQGWAQANPSLGYGRVTERTLASKSNEPEWVWRTEGLCQWSDGTLEGPFPAGTWDACKDVESQPREGSPLVLCLDVSWDRSMSYIGIAGIRDDGRIHIEIIKLGAGTEWVIPWLKFEPPHDVATGGGPRDQRTRGLSVVVQATGAPARSLIEAMETAGITVLPWAGPAIPKGTGQLYDLVKRRGIAHRGQQILDLSAATAVAKPSGDSYMWDRRRSPIDAAPLIAVTGAAQFVVTAAAQQYDVLESVF
jgi:phage terminase large subunit-like protein